MADHTGAVTVYRSADTDAERDAAVVRDVLLDHELDALLVGPDQPGVVSGSWEVRVPSHQADEAERLLASLEAEDELDPADPSRELDSVTLVETVGATGEMEALGIRSILEAADIPSFIVGNSTIPSLGFVVRVAKPDLERAQTAIAEAQAAGPAAAVEGEREGEESPA